MFAALVACANRSIDGAWYGPMPLPEAGECRVRLMPTGKFDFACAGAKRWAGVGSYGLSGSVLSITFEEVEVNGRREADMSRTLQADVRLAGNEMSLQFAGQSLTWVRRLSPPSATEE